MRASAPSQIASPTLETSNDARKSASEARSRSYDSLRSVMSMKVTTTPPMRSSLVRYGRTRIM